MAYYTGNGDTAQTAIFVSALQSKTYLIPGLTCRSDIKFDGAETINYWVAPSRTSAVVSTPGSAVSLSAKGLVKKTAVLSKAAQFGGIVPGVNIHTVTANAVNAIAQDEIMKSMNLINEAYITALETAGQAGTYQWAGTDVYADLSKARAEFVTTNKTEGYKPTAVFLNSANYSALLAKNLITYKDNVPNILGMVAIECPDLTSNAVLMHGDAMVAGAALSMIGYADGVGNGYPGGVVYGGEIPFGCEVTQLPSDFAGHLIIKF